jgi:uncharacterized protein (DUF302 family)
MRLLREDPTLQTELVMEVYSMIAAEQFASLAGPGSLLPVALGVLCPFPYNLGVRRPDVAVEVNDMTNQNGLVQVASRYSVDETVKRLQAAFAAKGLQVFALVDHSGEAEKVGLKMRPTKVLIFGSPKAGTPLMVAAPSLAIDLPLKALVAADAADKVSVTYNDPEYIRVRHGVPTELIKNLAGAGVVIGKAVE